MRTDHELDAPTGADGCGPEHQGLSRKAESWLGKRVSSEDSEANQL